MHDIIGHINTLIIIINNNIFKIGRSGDFHPTTVNSIEDIKEYQRRENIESAIFVVNYNERASIALLVSQWNIFSSFLILPREASIIFGNGKISGILKEKTYCEGCILNRSVKPCGNCNVKETYVLRGKIVERNKNIKDIIEISNITENKNVLDLDPEFTGASLISMNLEFRVFFTTPDEFLEIGPKILDIKSL